MIVAVSLYAFYAFFSGQATAFGAFTVLLVSYCIFGFLLGVSSHLASQRKAGWKPEEEKEVWKTSRPGRERRSESIILSDFRPGQMGYRPYKRILLIIVVVGFLLMLAMPVLGLILVFLATGPYLILRMVELFDRPAED